MATKTIVELLDDLDGAEAAETLSFGLDGRGYEIDLSEANAGKLRESLAPYIASARRAGANGNGKGPRTAAERRSGPSPRAVREWAKTQGIELSERGRVPLDVMKRYEDAGGK